jgi:N-acetylneuraminate lyase
MTNFRMSGLTAATVTPLNGNGSLRLEQVGPMVEHLIRSGVSGLFVCGSTGEGVSLTDEERKAVAEAYVDAADGRLPVIVQVGHNSLTAGRDLAAHASAIGADAISACGPSYFKFDDVEGLIEGMAFVAQGASQLPFYYYHIPALTGANFDMVEFLPRAADRIENLVGLKFTAPALDQFLHCLEVDNGRHDILWGVDEFMLGALATGATGAVGSTYNIAAGAYLQLIDAFRRGDMPQARHWQSLTVLLIRVLASYSFHSALRETLKLLDIECGECRLPKRSLTTAEKASLKSRLEAIGFFDWCGAGEDQRQLRLDPAANGNSLPKPASLARDHERT